ncbi:MAG: hypothetical protein AB7F59_12995 [Bdellovibrionales bacterium]
MVANKSSWLSSIILILTFVSDVVHANVNGSDYLNQSLNFIKNAPVFEIVRWPIVDANDLRGDVQSVSNAIWNPKPMNFNFFRGLKPDELALLPFKKRLALIQALLVVDYLPGSKIKSVILHARFPPANVFSADELTKALLAMPMKPNGVHYDSVEEKHIYENKELLKNVLIIVSSISNTPSFLSVWDQLPQEAKNKFRINTNTVEASSRVEPFDLIMNMFSRAYYVHSQLAYVGRSHELVGPNHRGIASGAYRGLMNLFGGSLVDDFKSVHQVPLFVFPRNSSGDFVVHCFGEKKNFSQASEVSFSALRHQRARHITCNEKEYEVLGALKTQREILAVDEPYLKNEITLNTIIYTGMISGISDLQLRAVDLSFATKLYKRESRYQDVSFVEFMERNFDKTHILINVDNSLGTDLFLPRYIRGTVIAYVKYDFTYSLKVKTSRIYVFIPQHSRNDEARRISWGDIIAKRVASGSPRLIIQNIACSSGTAPIVYSKLFDMAMRSRFSEETIKQHMPYILGADRRFSTQTGGLQHLRFPFQLIDTIFSGRGLVQAVKYLDSYSMDVFGLNPFGSLFNTWSFWPVTNFRTQDRKWLEQYGYFSMETPSIIIKAVDGSGEYIY